MKLRVKFSEHRFHHNFLGESPLCNCKEEIESTVHFFLHFPFYLVHRNNLLGQLSNILNNDVRQLPDDQLCDLLLFGRPSYNEIANKMILEAIVNFIIHMELSNDPIM